MDSNEKEGVCYPQPRTAEDRIRIAGDFVKRIHYEIPLLVDPIDDRANAAYAGLLAWTPGDGTVPSAATAEVTETVKGGASFGVGKGSEIQNVLLHASSGTFTLDVGGVATGPMSVSSTAAQVQNALEMLSTVGRGNVAVVVG